MLKSGILIKGNVYLPDHDEHQRMLEDLGIEDDYAGASKTFVRFELYPKGGDWTKPVSEWVYRVDQDILPCWYDAVEAEVSVRREVEAWAESKILIGKVVESIEDGLYYVCNGTVKEMRGRSTIKEMRGDSTVAEMYDSGTVMAMFGNSTVKAMYNGSTVNGMYDNSTVKDMYNRSTVKLMRGNSTVNMMYGNSTVNMMYGNSTVNMMHDNSTVNMMHDNSTVNMMRERSMIENMYENSTIKAMHDNSAVRNIYGIRKVDDICDSSIIQSDKNGNIVVSKDAKVVVLEGSR